MEKKEHTEKEERLLLFISKVNLSQKDFSEQIGITGRTLHNYIHNDRYPNPEYLIKMKELFNLNINWLLTGDGNMFNENRKKVVELKQEEKDLLLYFNFVSEPIQESVLKCLETIYKEQKQFVAR